jgi:hypothetical protein
MFDVQHHCKAYKNCCLSGLDHLSLGNGSYELENVDGLPYPDHINHDKLKKGFGYVISKIESIMTLGVM